jgi:hypothetical protein
METQKVGMQPQPKLVQEILRYLASKEIFHYRQKSGGVSTGDSRASELPKLRTSSV